MVSVLIPDSRGRIVIPKQVRDGLGITTKTKLLLTSNKTGQIIIQKLSIEEIAMQLEEEPVDMQVPQLVIEIRDMVNKKALHAIKNAV